MADYSPNFFRAYLAVALNAGTAASSVVLDRITTLTGETLETADFTTLGRGVLTVNPEGDGLTSFPESIKFTGVTSATKTLTGAVRGLTKAGATDTSLMRYHPVGTPVIISFGTHQITDLIAYLNTLVVSTRSVIVSGTAGETLVAGNLVYFDDTDNEWKKCDADTAATVENTLLGIAQGAGVNGGQIATGVLVAGKDLTNSGLTAGTKYYASNTAGGISTSPGTKEVTIGFGTVDGYLYFSPRFDQVLTENQQDLLEQFEAGTDWYAATATGNDSYAITITPAITAYATGMRFRFKTDVANTGAATLAVSGLAAKTIKKMNDRDLATGDIEAGQMVEVVYDGTNMQMVSQTGTQPSATDYQAFTGNGTWTKPAGTSATSKVIIEAWGAGGGGGALTGTSSSSGLGGGGGGAYVKREMLASDLAGTVAVTIGTGGSGATGAAGGNTTFGAHVTAYGGGGGATANNATGNGSGGGGGGALGVGGQGTPDSDAATGGAGGSPSGAISTARNSDGWGGGFGGAAATGAGDGGSGGVGGFGGGAGGGGNDGSSGAGGAGGASYYGGGGGGGGGATGGAAGASAYGGAGGAGGSANSAGSNGTAPGGGGGGGCRNTNGAAAGGSGAVGEVRVTTIL